MRGIARRARPRRPPSRIGTGRAPAVSPRRRSAHRRDNRASNAAVSIIGRIRPILLHRRVHTARFPRLGGSDAASPSREQDRKPAGCTLEARLKNAMRSDRRASVPRPRAIAARQGIRRMKEKPRGSRRKRCGESRGVLVRAGRRRASAPGALRRSRRVAGARIGATTGRRTRPYRSSAASGPFCSTDEFTPRVFRERNPPADGQRLRCPPRACRRMLGRKADIAHAPKFAYCESRGSGLRRPNRRADRLRMRARRAGDRGHAPHHA
ncbi:Uncharacterised protein [Burkholderia pseudomallei]|nr:Uncharacterised protein [Burkholderia pseudomallei]